MLCFVSLLGVLVWMTRGMYFWDGHELLHPLWRTREMLESWRAGGSAGAPWMPESAFGYGWPFFIFYAPLGYLAAAAAGLWLGLAGGVQFSFFAGLALGGVFVFAFLHEVTRRAGCRRPVAWGLTGALLFTVAPFHLTEVFVRSSLAESWGWTAAAATLWAIEYARRCPRGGFVAVALASAALILSHNITALYGALFFGLYVFATADSLRGLALAAGGGAAGAALSAWFWWPAMHLLPLVRAHQVQEFFGKPDWIRTHALFWPQFFVEDYGHGASRAGMDDTMSVNPGVMIIAGAALAAWALTRPGLVRIARRRVAVCLGLCVLTMFMMGHWMPWEHVPALFRYIQFPWRLLLFLVLFALAALGWAAPVVERLLNPLWLTLPAVGLALAMLPTMLIEPYEAVASDTELVEWYRGEEARIGHFAGCIVRDYLPVWVDERFADYEYLAAYPAPPDRLAPVTGVEALVFRRTGARYDYDLALAQAQTVTMHVYDFPGWRLTVDGQPAPQRLGRSAEGLLTLTLPAGNHRVVVEYREPPVRRAALGFSMLAALGLLAGFLLVGGLRRKRGAAR